MSYKAFSASTKAKAFMRCNGRCEGMIGEVKCNADLRGTEWDCDHIKADWEGGDNTLENAQCLCKACHKPKSAEDNRLTKRADRKSRRDMGIRKSSSAIIPGSKASGWKKKMDGTVVRR